MAYEPINATQIGSRLKTLREKTGKTLAEAADALGVSESALCMYENGNRIPRDEIKIRIADYYRRTVGQIFFPTKQHESCE